MSLQAEGKECTAHRNRGHHPVGVPNVREILPNTVVEGEGLKEPARYLVPE